MAKRKSRENPSYSLKEKARQILQFKTQKQAAKELGVSDRTIRRWLSGEVKKPKPQNQSKINRVSRNARRRAYRQGAPRGAPVAPPTRMIGRKRDQPMSDTRKLLRDQIVDYLEAASKVYRDVRFIIRIPKTPDYPEGYMTTQWESLLQDIPDLVYEYLSDGTIARVVIAP